MENILSKHKEFLDQLFSNIKDTGIDVSSYQLDHIAYRPFTKELYDARKIELNALGTMISEIDSAGRKISIFKLNEPLKYMHYEIPFFELLGPKEVNKYAEGYQHIEFVIDTSLQEFMQKFPALTFAIDHLNEVINPSINYEFEDVSGVEFHLRDIGEVVRLQDEEILKKRT